jgi:hypothetical protein
MPVSGCMWGASASSGVRRPCDARTLTPVRGHGWTRSLPSVAFFERPRLRWQTHVPSYLSKAILNLSGRGRTSSLLPLNLLLHQHLLSQDLLNHPQVVCLSIDYVLQLLDIAR